MRDTEAIRNLKSILRGTLRIVTNDDRAFIGTFVGTDKKLNILLVNTEEFRLGASHQNPTVGRYVGQVMIPWRLIQDIGLQVAGQSNHDAGGYADQVHLFSFRFPGPPPFLNTICSRTSHNISGQFATLPIIIRVVRVFSTI
jgi:N-alpha-acetyltransferase 38, NatC auxiliary subunit